MTYYKELIVWKKSYELGLDVYKVTKSFPVEEKYGIISQMRRCAISIPSNEDAVILLSKLDEVMKMLTSMAAKLA